MLRSRLSAVFLLAALLPAGPAAAQSCDRNGCGRLDCASPAHPVQQSLWGNLQPVDATPLPAERDTSRFNEFGPAPGSLYYNNNWFFGVDVENGWVLAGLAHGIGVWDARANPANPTFIVVKRYTPGRPFPFIPSGEGSKIVFGAIDAPDDMVAALAGYNGAGLLVFDLSDKTTPKPVYQNVDKTSESVYATRIGNTRYAFMASSTPAGVFIYDLDRALTFNGCLESSAAVCSGVLKGGIATAGTPYFVHGTGNYIAVGMGSSSGVQIFDVGNPLSPQLKLTALRNPGGRPVQGVAMWNQGSSYYLAARLGATATIPAQTAIFNVSCITASCSALGAPLATRNLSSVSTSEYLTFSRAGTKPFLYVGGDTSCSGSDGQQREWLLDVSDPSNPVDVTPQGVVSTVGNYGGTTVTKTVNYWSAYYRGSPTGFNLVSPRAGKFIGDYFYRAGRSIFDIHRLALNLPPVANFTWGPTEIYPGTPVTFTDQSTGVVTSWQWSFPGGTAAASTAPSSASGQSPPR